MKTRLTAIRTRALHMLAGVTLLTGTCLVLGACGSGQSSSVTTAQPAPKAQVTHASVAAAHPSRTQALAFAHAVNLHVSDIPEASLEPKRKRSESIREHEEERSCARSVEFAHKLVEVSSPKIKRGRELETEQFGSSVEVIEDAARIGAEFKAVEARRVRSCLARVLTRNFAEQAVGNARWRPVKVSRLPVDLPGADHAAGIRVTAAIEGTFSEVSVPIYVDLLVFSHGPAEVSLGAISATQPVPASTEHELLELLLQRAYAHPL